MANQADGCRAVVDDQEPSWPTLSRNQGDALCVVGAVPERQLRHERDLVASDNLDILSVGGVMPPVHPDGSVEIHRRASQNKHVVAVAAQVSHAQSTKIEEVLAVGRRAERQPGGVVRALQRLDLQNRGPTSQHRAPQPQQDAFLERNQTSTSSPLSLLGIPRNIEKCSSEPSAAVSSAVSTADVNT